MFRVCLFLGLFFSVNAECQNEFTYIEKIMCISKYSRPFQPHCSFVTTNNKYHKVRAIDTQTIVCSNVNSEVSFNYSYQQANHHNLVIVNSTIPVIPDNSSLVDFERIDSLILKDLKIEEIRSGAFDGWHRLWSLDLSDNNLRQVPEEIGNSLGGLRRLDLSNNTIRDIQEEDFSNLVHLKYLSLKHNIITSLSSEIFQNLTELEEIDLSYNPLNVIRDLSFSNLKRFIAIHSNIERVDNDFSNLTMDYVDLSNNYLEDFDFDKFPDVAKLILENNGLNHIINFKSISGDEIILRKNLLTHIDEIPINVSSLDLSHNSISSFNVSNQESNLKKLNLGHNNISHLEPDTFSSLKELETLLLDNNCLETLEENFVGHCPSLKELDISSNGLKIIKKDAFKNVPGLNILKLSNNSLKTLSVDMFPEEFNITDLFIDSNKFRSLNYEVFNTTFPALKLISLGNNDWICEDLEQLMEGFRKRNVEVKGAPTSCPKQSKKR